MLRVLILTFAVSLTLAACSGLSADGSGLRIDDLPPNVRLNCPPPSDYLSAGDWEIIAGRIGDALIRCEGRRELAVEGYDGVRRALHRSN